jgi:prevent-host-death family protein
MAGEHRITLSEAKARLSTWVNRVAFTRETVVLESHGRPKAVLLGLDSFRDLQAGSDGGRLARQRLEGLRRIAKLGARMRRRRARPAVGDAAEDLARVRSERDAALDRLR